MSIFKKGILFSQMSEQERKLAHFTMYKNSSKSLWIKSAFEMAWNDFKNNKFRFDGATFVVEHQDEFWEVAAFIHDWLNNLGYVGKAIDIYFIEIMRQLGYSSRRIFERSKWMQYTCLNVFWHKVKGTYKSNKLPEWLPKPTINY